MASIVQIKERGGMRRHDQGGVIDLHFQLNDWFDWFCGIEGLSPRWVENAGFVVFNSRTNQIIDRFEVRVN